MKTTITLICLVVSGLLHGQATFNPADLDAIARGDREAFARKHPERAPSSTANYDVKYYRCVWNIDPALDSIWGNVTTLFVPVQGGIDTLALDLSHNLLVDSVLYHDHQAPYIHMLDRLTVRFPFTLPYLTPDSLTVYYHGVPPEDGFGSFVQDTHNDVPVIWTLSEPYGASDWWPCKNGLTDKADSMDIFIRTPAANKAASNGVLVSATKEGANTLYHWKHKYPIATYLVCLGVTNYSVYTQKVSFGTDTLDVVNYIYPEDSAAVYSQTAAVGPMIQLFDSLFGIYPFQEEKYGHAEFGWGGGMENQTMTFVTSFGFELLAHELGHQWFGDKVTCGTWSDIWLNEGFGTYLSGLCYEYLEPAFWQRFRQVRINSIMSKPGGSVFCTDTTDIGRIFDTRLSYAKGAMILHQLRWIMGDSAFFAASRNYLADAALSYGFARTEDLKTHLEASCGQDLTWYFDDWYTGEGYPTYQLSWSQVNDTVSLTVSQTQSHPSVSFFEMILPVKFKNATRDSLLRLSNTFSGETFRVKMPFAVDSVLFDPGYELIAGNHHVDAIGEHPRLQTLQVFPVPADEQVCFRLNDPPFRENGRISIYDHSGRLVDELRCATGETQISLDTRNYPQGLYFYRHSAYGNPGSGKFIIVR